MPGITISDNAMRTLTGALDGLALSQRVIGSNMANADTPGFKSSEVRFAEQLTAAQQTQGGLQMVSTSPMHLGTAVEPTQAQVITNSNTSLRLDGNNVDIEKEVTNLSETVLHYQATTQMMSQKLALLRTVINDGRR
jgi:flagellar basal-body rod protein FlgB